MIRIFFFFVIFLTVSCNKNRNLNPVPSIPFDVTIHLELPSYSALQGIGGACYYDNCGAQGIVIYRKSMDEFVAYDRQSPASETKCALPLTMDVENMLQLNDSCTGAKFSLYDGSIISGSTFGLRQYQTAWNGSNLLRVYN
jgi:hypothetical protein